ncbi:helix-turn-helix transcriptional regulator [Pseudomonas sp. RIT-PI-S]|uniref:helix-turn-helix transcriptional regulator n=1 Tax=Pseudomonas sp. RIT-PI-S TaxID=3035295 RepID=UPI0021D92F9E|nr:helix-turn-helix transcriptional regulator [Pseudomonas sp. RIT-PI-S]
MHTQDVALWTEELTRVFAAAPAQRLDALCAWLGRVRPVDHFVLFVYEGNHRPLALFDTFPAQRRKVYVDDYQSGPYLLDPIYLACARGQAPGLWRLRQLAPDHFYLGEYYLTYYQQTGLAEEVAFFVDLGEGTRGVLSLMRANHRVAFSEDDLAWLGCARAAVEQVVVDAWALHQAGPPRPAQDLDFTIRAAFDQFGAHCLTQREQEIVQLLLRGHSSASVAEVLGISPGTVKIHRKHLYAKLAINSQSELLGLFIRDLAGPANPGRHV